MIIKSILEHNVEPNQDNKSAGAKDFEQESLNPDEFAKLHAKSKSSLP